MCLEPPRPNMPGSVTPGQNKQRGPVPERIGDPGEDVCAGGHEAPEARVQARARERLDLGLEQRVDRLVAHAGSDEDRALRGAPVPGQLLRVVDER